MPTPLPRVGRGPPPAALLILAAVLAGCGGGTSAVAHGHSSSGGGARAGGGTGGGAMTTPFVRPPQSHPPPSAFGDQVDRILARLPLASVAFNVPRTMQLDQSAEIQLLLSLRRSIAGVESQLTELGAREGARVRVSDQLEARLTGLGFRVLAETPERQAISAIDTTEWRWQIQPTATGVHRLHLTLTALVRLRGSDEERTIRTFERTLDVRVTWQHRVSAFLGGNWQWLWAAVLVPAAGVALRGRRRKRPPSLG